MENLKAWNGSLLIVNVSCGNKESQEVHCILLKLKSLLRTYPEVSITLFHKLVDQSSPVDLNIGFLQRELNIN